MNHRYPILQGIMAILEMMDFTIELDGPLVFLVDAEQTLHQRRFARTILTHEGMYRPGFHPEGDTVQGSYSGKHLGHRLHFQGECAFHVTSSFLYFYRRS